MQLLESRWEVHKLSTQSYPHHRETLPFSLGFVHSHCNSLATLKYNMLHVSIFAQTLPFP